jgi:hypothetical protein
MSNIITVVGTSNYRGIEVDLEVIHENEKSIFTEANSKLGINFATMREREKSYIVWDKESKKRRHGSSNEFKILNMDMKSSPNKDSIKDGDIPLQNLFSPNRSHKSNLTSFAMLAAVADNIPLDPSSIDLNEIALESVGKPKVAAKPNPKTKALVNSMMNYKRSKQNG